MNNDDKINELNENIKVLSQNIEKINTSGFLDLISKPKKMFFLNLLWGLSRGIGMAVGFTILGAVVLSMLKSLVTLNIPLIGNYIADIVKIVQENLK